MQRLKQRRAPDNLRTQTRRGGGRLGRVLYLTALAGIALWIANAFAGHLVYFRAQGLVVADVAELGSEYTARVKNVAVSRGQSVGEGAPIAEVASQEVSERIARIAADIARSRGELAGVKAELAGRVKLINEARMRLRVAERTRDSYDQVDEKGLITNQERLRFEDQYYTAVQEVRRLETAIETLRAERDALGTRVEAAETALRDLRATFDNGVVRAPWDGIVSDVSVLPGSVVQPGEPIARIARKETYVLAYRATGTLYDVAVGEEVIVSDGVRDYPGRIVRILPLTAKLPEAFRRAFRPAAREQVLRIAFDDGIDDPPPLNAAVEVRRPGWWVTRKLGALFSAP